MKNFRAVAAAWCVVGAVFCGAAWGEPGEETAKAMEKTPVAGDSSAAAGRLSEAEPVMRMVERERARPREVFDTENRTMRIMVNSVLAMVALFTVYSFLSIKKAGDYEYREETVRKRSRWGAKKKSPAVVESIAVRESKPQSPLERAERLKSRRDSCAAEIDRLMKRV